MYCPDQYYVTCIKIRKPFLSGQYTWSYITQLPKKDVTRTVASISKSLSESVDDLRADIRYRGVHRQGTTLQTHLEASRSIAPDTPQTPLTVYTGWLSSLILRFDLHMRRTFVVRLLSLNVIDQLFLWRQNRT